MKDERETLYKLLDKAATKLDERSHQMGTLEEKVSFKRASQALAEAQRQVKLAWFMLEDAGMGEPRRQHYT